jgi:death-on-curing protein
VRYLRVEDVLRFSELEVGPELLTDFGLLESAVLRPQATFGGADLYPDFASKAAVLVFSLIRNHPFIDGNKRTGVGALEAFCLLNGYELAGEDADIVGLALDIAEGTITVEAIAGQIKSWLRALVPEDFDADERGK